MKIKRIHPSRSIYLHPLATLVKGPAFLYVRGQLPDSRLPTVAIVGSRKPTAYGREVTYQLAYELARKGVVIVSGLALGVDGIAHRAALDAGGLTIALLAQGLDSVYPRTHAALAQEIIDKGGALLSEYEPGTTARSFQFLARNRLVSGLSDALIVTEAARRSGTLATVAAALEQGREVFAVPGNITSVLSIGPNRLIRQGAQPVTSVEDILEAIAPRLLEPQTTLALGSTPAETAIIHLLQEGVRDGDLLHQRSRIDISDFSQALTMLELNGTVRSLGGNQWTLR